MESKPTESAEEQPTESSDVESTQSSADQPPESVSWEASEFVQHEKPAWWYLALIGAAVALCAVFTLLHQWPTVALVVVMTLAVWVYSNKTPRTLQYGLNDEGITIQAKLQPYSHFKSYSTHSAPGWQEIDLEPAKRFSPRLTLLISNDKFDAIERLLALHLPRVERSHDLIEQLARYIKF